MDIFLYIDSVKIINTFNLNRCEFFQFKPNQRYLGTFEISITIFFLI